MNHNRAGISDVVLLQVLVFTPRLVAFIHETLVISLIRMRFFVVSCLVCICMCVWDMVFSSTYTMKTVTHIEKCEQSKDHMYICVLTI